MCLRMRDTYLAFVFIFAHVSFSVTVFFTSVSLRLHLCVQFSSVCALLYACMLVLLFVCVCFCSFYVFIYLLFMRCDFPIGCCLPSLRCNNSRLPFIAIGLCGDLNGYFNPSSNIEYGKSAVPGIASLHAVGAFRHHDFVYYITFLAVLLVCSRSALAHL